MALLSGVTQCSKRWFRFCIPFTAYKDGTFLLTLGYIDVIFQQSDFFILLLHSFN
jgi:hypothetical protein